jgi:autotransporter-associated beta strand protein
MTIRSLLLFLAALCAAGALWAADGTWTAGTGGDWNTPGNWQDDIVAEGSGSTAYLASGTGTINNDHTDLALLGVQFAGGGYTLAGGTLTLDAAGFITVLGGSHTASAPLVLSGSTAIDVASGQTLTLDGELSGAGGVTVRGGRVVLGNADNTYLGATVMVTGIVEIASVGAFGDSSADPANLVIGDGTLRYTGPSATLGRGYTVAPTNFGNRAAAIDVTDADATLIVDGKVVSPNGCFIKTGDGTLAFTYPGYQELNKSRGANMEASPLVFDANGSAGTNGHAIFTVDKGRVILGAPGQTNVIVANAWVGSRTLASPRLDITGGVTRITGTYFTIGRGTGTTASPQTPSVYVSNGAYLELHSFVMGYANNQPSFFSKPTLHIDGATAVVQNNCFLSENASLLTTITVTNSGLFRSDSPQPDFGMSISQSAGALTHVNIGASSTGSAYQVRLGRGGNLNVTQNSVFELDTTPTNAVAANLNLGTARFNAGTLKQRTEKLSSDWFQGVTNLLYGAGGMSLNVASHAWLDATPKPDAASPGGSVTKTGNGTLVIRPSPYPMTVAAGRLALNTEYAYATNGLSGTLTVAPGAALELGAAGGAANMTLDLAGAPLYLTPHSLASNPDLWAFTSRAMRRADNILQLTPEIGSAGSLQNQKGGACLVQKQKVDGPWTLTFSYICWATGTDPADGFSFVLHNDPRGAGALGDHGANLGYVGSATTKITNSVAAGFNVTGHQLRFGKQGAFVDNRTLPTTLPKLAVQPVKAKVTVSYDGAGLMTVLIDRAGAPGYRAAWAVDVAAEVGASEAYLGFTAGTAGRWGQHSVTDVLFDNGTVTPPAYCRTGGRVALGTGAALNAYTAPSSQQRGFVLGELAYGDQSVVNAEALTLMADPPEPTLLNQAMWKLNGFANWKTDGRLAVSTNNNNSSGSAFCTNLYPVAGSWTARFDYDIGLMSSPPADYITFAIQNQSTNSTGHTHNPGFAIMWRYYEGGVTTTSLRMYTNNVAVLATTNIAPVSLRNGGPAVMTVAHDAAAKTVTVITSQAAGAYTNVFTGVDMLAAVGSPKAYLGFGAFTGGLNAENIVSGFSFTWPKASAGYLAFDKLAGSGTLVKRGGAALGLLGDLDRPTSNAVVRLEQGGLVLRKDSVEPPVTSGSRSDWVFSPQGRWAEGTLQVCPSVGSTSGVGTSTRRVNVKEPWTASFQFSFGRRSTNPADAFSMFFHNDPRGPTALGGIYGSAGYAGIANSFGLRWYFYPLNPDADTETLCIGRNAAWNTGTKQTHAPIAFTNGATDFAISYNPTAATLTSIMTQGALCVTNTFTGINIPADVGADYAYVGFGGGTGGSYADMRIRDFSMVYDTSADPLSGQDYLASLLLPDASTNTVTLDASLVNGTFRIAAAAVGDGATLGVDTAQQPGTLVLGSVTQSGDATYPVAGGCTLTLTDVAGGGTVTKTGAGTLALAGAAATYGGDTVLAAGTLALDAARLPTGTDLYVTPGATLNLAFTGKQYVHSLFVDGAPMHGGQYTSANTTWITGSGILVVTYPPVGSLMMLQ